MESELIDLLMPPAAGLHDRKAYVCVFVCVCGMFTLLLAR